VLRELQRADQRRVRSVHCAVCADLCAVSAAVGSQPGARLVLVVEHLDLGGDEELRHPGAPGQPLVLGQHRDAAEIARVLARELDLLPRHVEREAGHLAQVEEQVDRPLELDVVIDHVLELLVVGQGEFAEDGRGQPVFSVLSVLIMTASMEWAGCPNYSPDAGPAQSSPAAACGSGTAFAGGERDDDGAGDDQRDRQPGARRHDLVPQQHAEQAGEHHGRVAQVGGDDGAAVAVGARHRELGEAAEQPDAEQRRQLARVGEVQIAEQAQARPIVVVISENQNTVRTSGSPLRPSSRRLM
jgi:hypothetical protein